MNHQDLSFVKVNIDGKSTNFLKENLKNIDDVLLRSLVWKNFYEMVKDASINMKEYSEIIINNVFD